MTEQKPKHAGGRPPKYATPEAMQAGIEEYFAECARTETHPAVTGLTLSLGFCERKALIDYAEKPEFRHIIKEAKGRIETMVEQRLMGNTQVAGAIFWLKNMGTGWKDRSEVETDMKLSGHIGITDMSNEALEQRIAELMGQK
jgi:hypothetical protein